MNESPPEVNLKLDFTTNSFTKIRNNDLNFFTERQNTNLPYSIEIDTGIEGSSVAIVGALHGSEPVGVEASVEVINKIEGGEIDLKSGKLLFILGNPEGYLQNKRFIDSDLNREFINLEDAAQSSSNYEKRRAIEIANFLKNYRADFLLDLHSVDIGDIQMELFDLENPVPKELTNEKILRIILDKNVMNGGLCQLPIFSSAMSMECGDHTSIFGKQRALIKISNILNFYELTDKLKFESKLEDEFIQNNNQYQLISPIIPQLGFKFTSATIHSEQFVAKNEIYATYIKNGKLKNLRAAQDCYILMPCPNPNINDTDAGFLAIKVD